jgi:predicted transcriptional regulator
MHINVHFDNQTAMRLNHAAEKQGESHDAVIRCAVNEWLARNSLSQWPDEVLAFKGMADLPLFEASRDKFAPAVEDPLV